jgi:alpha-L-glutamate ligase-like protein
MLNIFRGLKNKGILGINGRNANFTLKFNPRRFYPLVDDKLRTKRLAQANGIPVPELYALIEAAGQVRDLPDALKEYSNFVIKPAHGSGGEGILIVSREDNGAFRRQNGEPLTLEGLKHHVLNSLSGLYSLGGQPDEVLAEYRVEFDPVFEKISYEGVPDIRIVVMFGIPVMAMIRLPTKESDGKANLHQGAIGVGICMKTGTTLRGVWKNNIVTEHPDTGNSVTGLTIPWWDDLLELSAKWYELTELGYLGVDIVLDKSRGPLILELNARPGLNIQVANDSGLIPRLQLAERYREDLKNVSERVAFAKDNFAATAVN